jgi:hypothetical protein
MKSSSIARAHVERALWLLLAVALCGAGGASQGAGPFPLRFESELVRLVIGPDSLTVEGTYRLSCRRSAGGTANLFYPYPRDDWMGAARTVSLEGRGPDGVWRRLLFREVSDGLGAAWAIPLDQADTLEVRTVYRQGLVTEFARYIVTSTRSWGRPLARARFEVYFPRELVPESFSFPFVPGECMGRPCYHYETTEFLPDRDIEVRWRSSEPAEH